MCGKVLTVTSGVDLHAVLLWEAKGILHPDSQLEKKIRPTYDEI